MSKTEIKAFRASWKANTNEGFLAFQWMNNTWSKWFKVADRSEYLIFLTILQSEGRVFWIVNGRNRWIQTHDVEIDDDNDVSDNPLDS